MTAQERREYQNKWRLGRLEKARSLARERYWANVEKEREKARERRKTNPSINREAKKRYNAAHPEYQRKRNKIFRETLNNIKMSRGCCDCGYKAHPAALDFDHVRGVKKFSPSLAGSVASAVKEAEKCEVRCANCHRIATFVRAANIRLKGLALAGAGAFNHPNVATIFCGNIHN